jgi:hypothetical protein
MADLVFVGIALAFFGLCVLYVLGLDKLIGRDHAPSESGDQHVEAEVTVR